MNITYCARRNFAIGRAHAVIGNFSKFNVRLLVFLPALLAFVLISKIVHRVRKSLADSRARTELDALAAEFDAAGQAGWG